MDPQTSGGLLMAVPAVRLGDFQSICAEQGQPAWVIGKLLPVKASRFYPK